MDTITMPESARDSIKASVQTRLLFLEFTRKGDLGNILKYFFDTIVQHMELDYKIVI